MSVVCARLTAPFRICITGAAVHNFKDDRSGIAGLADSVVCAIILGVDELETLATRQIVIQWPRQIRPELHIFRQSVSDLTAPSPRVNAYLGVVVTIGCCKVPPHRQVRRCRILAEAWVCQAERIARVSNRLADPAFRFVAVRAQTVQAKATSSAARFSEVGRPLLARLFSQF